MGTDNYFKRKQRSLRSLERKSKERKPYDVVLIICEGTKTEPYYLNGLRESLRLSNTNIVIENCAGTDPISIVDHALEKHRNKNKDYDRVYCVFDKEHSNYQSALDKINSHAKNDIPIYAIPSVPCFEYWILLHFKDTTKPYQPKGKKSVGDQLKSELKKHIKEYHEADKDIFGKTKQHLGKALIRAKRIDKSQKENGTDNPSTKVYELVEYLMKIK